MSLYELNIPNEIFAHEYTINHIHQLPMIYDATDGKQVPIKTEKTGYRYVSLKVKEIKYDETGDITRRSTIIKSKKFRLHRLIAMQYIPKTKDDIFYNRDQVIIINGNKDNLSTDNLIWMNRYESTGLSILKNKGMDRLYEYFIENDQVVDLNNLIHILFDTKILKNRIFKKRYLLKEIKRVSNNMLVNTL